MYAEAYHSQVKDAEPVTDLGPRELLQMLFLHLQTYKLLCLAYYNKRCYTGSMHFFYNHKKKIVI